MNNSGVNHDADDEVKCTQDTRTHLCTYRLYYLCQNFARRYPALPGVTLTLTIPTKPQP